ncbi:MAG TPA: ABC transporter substrate-binding protein, partial [Herpetosiphonaceae bacterium]|nr:ABC transporter substrate-binding protein [Herpetosiphonaceae bacterium]
MQSLRRIGLCLVLLASLVACGEQAATFTPAATATPAPTTVAAPADEPAGGPVSITDATGTTLRFDAPPQRIVCLYHECIELMSGLGVAPVAMLAPGWLPNFADDPAYFSQPNSIVKLTEQDSGSWDYEQIAALTPDIVFGSNDDRTALEGIAPVYSVGDSYSMTNQDTLDHMAEFGRLLGREAEAQAAVKAFQDRLAAYAKRAPRDRSVLLVASDLELAWIYSGKSVPCSILNLIA